MGKEGNVYSILDRSFTTPIVLSRFDLFEKIAEQRPSNLRENLLCSIVHEIVL